MLWAVARKGDLMPVERQTNRGHGDRGGWSVIGCCAARRCLGLGVIKVVDADLLSKGGVGKSAILGGVNF